MNSANRATQSPAADVRTIALGYTPAGGADKLWISAGGTHRVAVDHAQTAQLLAALLDFVPQPGARLVVLGSEIDGLDSDARRALQARIAILPPDGGLISHLNAWENIVLSLGFHHPRRLPGSLAEVEALLSGLGAEPRALLAKLPEEMTLYEKKLTGYVRILLEAPELMLAVDLSGGLETVEREWVARYPAAYHVARAGGTFIEFTAASDA